MIKMCLADICSLNMGQSPNSSSYNTTGEGIPFYQGNADFGKVSPKTTTWCTEPKKIAEPGDILLSVRAPIGAINIANEKCCIGRGLVAISPASENIRASYIKQALLASRKSLEFLGSGSTFKAIGKKSLGEFLIPVYSLPMQIEIENRFSQVSICIELLRDVLKKLDELVKSRFVEMFGYIGEGTFIYPPKRIEDLCLEIIGGGTPSMKHPEYYGGSIPFIKSGDVKSQVVTNGNLSITKEGLKRSSAKLAPMHSILVVTRSGILKHTLPIAIAGCSVAINQDLKALVLNESVIPEYIQWSLLVSEQLILSKVRATTADNIETSLLKNFMVPVPPLQLQHEFADFAAQVDKLKFDFDFLVSFSIPSICLFCLKLDP